MKFFTLLVAALLVGGLGGCASAVKAPAPAVVAAAKFDPVPANLKEQIKAQFGAMLKDPYSATYQFGPAKKVYFQGPDHMMFGYMVEVVVNAKNSYGGYTGGEVYYWTWSEGNLYNTKNSVKFGGTALLE